MPRFYALTFPECDDPVADRSAAASVNMRARKATANILANVMKHEDGNFKGQLKTLSFRAPIDILLNPSKSSDTQPDYRVYSQNVEIGAGWIKKGKTSGEHYVSLSLADPAFGPKKLYANLGRAAGQDDDEVFAIIWNPTE